MISSMVVLEAVVVEEEEGGSCALEIGGLHDWLYGLLGECEGEGVVDEMN